MKKKVAFGIIGGVIGLTVGLFLGGYVGLIIGGTFLGEIEIYEHIGIEGYELSTYIGAVIGGVIISIFGIKYALKRANNSK